MSAHFIFLLITQFFFPSNLEAIYIFKWRFKTLQMATFTAFPSHF